MTLSYRGLLARKVSSSNENIVTASVSSSAVPASYQVCVKQLATAATNSSTGRISAAAALTGDTLDVDVVNTTTANRFKISLDGEEMEIRLQENASYDLNELVNDIQTQINESSLEGKVFVSLTKDNQLRFAAVRQDDGSVPTIKVTGDALTVLGFEEEQTSQSLEPIDTSASLGHREISFYLIILSGLRTINFGLPSMERSLFLTGIQTPLIVLLLPLIKIQKQGSVYFIMRGLTGSL